MVLHVYIIIEVYCNILSNLIEQIIKGTDCVVPSHHIGLRENVE